MKIVNRGQILHWRVWILLFANNYLAGQTDILKLKQWIVKGFNGFRYIILNSTIFILKKGKNIDLALKIIGFESSILRSTLLQKW